MINRFGKFIAVIFAITFLLGASSTYIRSNQAPPNATDPNCSARYNGHFWYNTTTHVVKGCFNGSTATFSTGLTGSGTANTLPLWTAAQTLGDSILIQSGTSLIEQRSGTTAQLKRIYRTFTDASNYERLELSSDTPFATGFNIASRSAGTGTSRSLNIGTHGASAVIFWSSNTSRWQISPTGNYIATTDNTLDIGASGATRPRTGHFGTSVIAPMVTAATLGDVSSATRVKTSLATPGSLINGDFWVECVGTSPSRICAIKVQDAGSARTIGSVTY